MKKLKSYPTWVCPVCAKNALTEDDLKKLDGHLATFHFGICGVCGEERSVTEPRDYGYCKFKGFENP